MVAGCCQITVHLSINAFHRDRGSTVHLYKIWLLRLSATEDARHKDLALGHNTQHRIRFSGSLDAIVNSNEICVGMCWGTPGVLSRHWRDKTGNRGTMSGQSQHIPRQWRDISGHGRVIGIT